MNNSSNADIVDGNLEENLFAINPSSKGTLSTLDKKSSHMI